MASPGSVADIGDLYFDVPVSAVPSLGRRYTYKLGAGIVGLAAALGTQTIVPRALGPESLGHYAFLTNFFGQLAGMLSIGVSLAFVTKLAARPNEVKLVSFFRYVVIGIGATILLFTAAAFAMRFDHQLWPGERGAYVWMAALLGFGLWSLDSLGGVNDALGFTVPAERTRIATKLTGLLVLAGMFLLGVLTLGSYFAWSIGSVVSLGAFWLRLLHRNPSLRRVPWVLAREDRQRYAREFIAYCGPLAAYAVANSIALLFDRWLLQRFAGAREQGFYGFSYQLGALIFLGTSAIVPLLTREFSVAHGRSDVPRMAQLFKDTLPRLFFVAAFFGAFAAVNARSFVSLFGGTAYAAAAAPVAIMAFYPMHQTYGQVSGGLFYATGRTALYRNIGVTTLLIGIPISFLLFASRDAGGMGLGATALAGKMLVFQIVVVNVQLYFNAKMLKLSLAPFLVHQLLTVAVLVAVALGGAGLVWGASGSWRAMPQMSAPQLIVAGFLYGVVVLGLVAVFPRLAGLRREELRAIIARMERLLSARRRTAP